MAPPDHTRDPRFSWIEVSALLPSLFSSISGNRAESVALTTEGSAVRSPDLRAMFWTASPTGYPVTARLRTTQGPATTANPPNRTARARHLAPAPNFRAAPHAATARRAPAEYSVRNRAPHRAPRAQSGAKARPRSSADSTRHHAWNAPRASTIMSAVPLIATTSFHAGSETKRATAASQPEGAPKRRRARSNASQIANQNSARFSASRK